MTRARDLAHLCTVCRYHGGKLWQMLCQHQMLARGARFARGRGAQGAGLESALDIRRPWPRLFMIGGSDAQPPIRAATGPAHSGVRTLSCLRSR